MLFLEKSLVLFKTVIALLKHSRTKLKTIFSIEEFRNYLKDTFSHYDDLNHLKYVLILRKFEFNLDFLNKNRRLLASSIIENIEKINATRIVKHKERIKDIDTECNDTWQYCIYDAESSHKVHEFFVYKAMYSPLIYEDYFEEKTIKLRRYSSTTASLSTRIFSSASVSKYKTNSYVDYDTALIERKQHVCTSREKFASNQRLQFRFSIGVDNSSNNSTDLGTPKVEPQQVQGTEEITNLPGTRLASTDETTQEKRRRYSKY